MKNKLVFPAILAIAASVSQLACQKDNPSADNANLQFKMKFDPDQERLNNIGLPEAVPSGHGAQTPSFRKMSVHYIELAPGALTPLGSGAVVFKGAETSAGGANAVDFDKASVVGADEVFAKINLKDVPPGTYEWVRTSVTFQNFDVKFNLRKLPAGIPDLENQSLTVASFVGFNTYIHTVSPKNKVLTVNDDKKQGFWAVETGFSAPYDIYNDLLSGEAPAGATTVVNPLFATSPIPAGSCVVTGKLTTPLVITGNETADRTVTLSFSVNHSFEWVDDNANGQLDFYGDGATANEKPVNMGLRGLIPSWE